MTNFPNREFDQDSGGAKKANIVDLLAMPGAEAVEFEAPRLDRFFQPAELTD